jgi:hypothetical protein
VFKECGKPKTIPNDRVVILDPCNVENNVGGKLTEADCETLVSKCEEAWETLTTARNNGAKGETLELWKEVFGRSFVIEE